jgi:hypothetical protein
MIRSIWVRNYAIEPGSRKIGLPTTATEGVPGGPTRLIIDDPVANSLLGLAEIRAREVITLLRQIV